MSEALSPLVRLWVEKFTLAEEDRKRRFAKDATLAERYYKCQRYGDDFQGFSISEKEGGLGPTFKVTSNKMTEMVHLIGPLLYHKNPVRTITPKQDWSPPASVQQMLSQSAMQGMQGQEMSPLAQQLAQSADPQFAAQQATMKRELQDAKSDVMQRVMNYIAHESGLREEMRFAVDEALVARSCLWTEMYTPPGSQIKYPKTTYDSWKNLLIDPDMQRLKDSKWISRIRCRPMWEIERERPWLPKDKLKANKETAETTGSVNTGIAGDDKKRGQTSDLVTYYCVYSKMGIGARLKSRTAREELSEAVRIFEKFGDYIYLEIHDGCEYPLNIPPEYIDTLVKLTPEDLETVFNPPPPPEPEMDPMTGMPAVDPMTGMPQQAYDPIAHLRPIIAMVDDMRQRLKWPIEFWIDDEWPMTPIDLHPMYDSPWPMPHLKPGFGEQDFLAWAYTALAGHIWVTHRDFLAIAKGADENLKDTVTHGAHLSVIEVSAHNRNIHEVVSFLQHPQLNKDFLPIIQIVEHNLDKRLGTSEYLYGQTATESRSAADAQMKSQATQIRPDDMAERVEYAASQIARKEAIAARLFMRGQDVAAILGEQGATFWDQQIASEDFVMAAREFDFRVEAGTARKPNRDKQVADTAEGAQYLMPALQQFGAATGHWQPVLAFLRNYAEAREVDIEEYVGGLEPRLEQMEQLQQAQQQLQLMQIQMQLMQTQMQMQMMMQPQPAQQPQNGQPTNGQPVAA